jgi:hypothetical protein
VVSKKDKKSKKKKKDKKSRREDGSRHKSKPYHHGVFSGLACLGLPSTTNVDEIAAQYDFFDYNLPSRMHQNHNSIEMLQLTNQKTSGNSKIYPGGMYELGQHSRSKFKD